jgi:hypothetical protein
MADMLNFDFKLEGVKEALETFDPKIVKQAIRSTLDKTGTAIKKEMVDQVTSKYNIKAKDVRDAITVDRTTQTRSSVGITVKGAKLQLFKYFKATQGKWGIYVEIMKGRLVRIEHAFIQVARRGHNPGWKGVMLRKGGMTHERKPGRKKEQAFHGLPGPSIPDIIGSSKIMPKVEAKIADTMQSLFEAEIEKRITRGSNAPGNFTVETE